MTTARLVVCPNMSLATESCSICFADSAFVEREREGGGSGTGLVIVCCLGRECIFFKEGEGVIGCCHNFISCGLCQLVARLITYQGTAPSDLSSSKHIPRNQVVVSFLYLD